MSDNKKTSITGLWKRESNFGTFFTANVTKSEIIKLLDGHGENITLFVSPITEKAKDNSPDIRLAVGDNTYAGK